MRRSLPKLLLSLIGALIVAWGVYFATLFSIDHLFGAQQLEQALLASPGRLARRLLATIAAGSPVVTPVIAGYGLIVIAITGHRYLLRTMLAIAAGASVLIATLLWLGFTPLQALPFLFGFIAAMLFIRQLWCRKPS